MLDVIVMDVDMMESWQELWRHSYREKQSWREHIMNMWAEHEYISAFEGTAGKKVTDTRGQQHETQASDRKFSSCFIYDFVCLKLG